MKLGGWFKMGYLLKMFIIECAVTHTKLVLPDPNTGGIIGDSNGGIGGKS